jgi:hypothetical protein
MRPSTDAIQMLLFEDRPRRFADFSVRRDAALQVLASDQRYDAILPS